MNDPRGSCMQGSPPDRVHREAAVSDLDRSMALEASAGTGKTSLIVERAVNLIEDGRAEIHELAVITFTEKAAAELEERVREILDGRICARSKAASVAAGLDPRLVRLLTARSDLDRAAIQTIHSFAASLLRRRPVEAGVDPEFAVTDREGQRALIDEAWREALGQSAAQSGQSLRALLMADVSLESLRALAERFAENRDLAATGAPGAVAPPDAGEWAQGMDEWIAAEIAWARGVCPDPSDKLRSSIEKAASDIRRARQRSPGSLHRLLLGPALQLKGRLGLKAHWKGGTLDRARGVQQEWNRRLGDYRDAFGAHLAGEASRWLAGFLEVYRNRKRTRGVVDFQDLLIGGRDLLRNPTAAAQLRRIHPYVLVDEFQDTDPLQMELVALLTGEGEGADWRSRTPKEGSLFIVGDPKQSIYRFRRADVALYAQMRDWLAAREGKGAHRTITANFRTRPGIAAWVNALFGALFTGAGEGAVSYAPLDAQRAEAGGPTVLYLDSDPVPGSSIGAPPAAGGSIGVSTSSDAAIARSTPADPRVRTPLAAAGPDSRSASGVPEGESEPAAIAPGARVDGRSREAAVIATCIRRGIREHWWRVEDQELRAERPARLGDVALLLRAFSDVSVYEDAFREAEVDFATSSGREYFVRREVAGFGSLLRAVESPRDELAVVAALRSPYFGVSDDAILETHLAIGGLDPLRPARAPGDAGEALARIGAWHLRRNDGPVGVMVRRILDESGGLVFAALRPDGERTAINLLKIVDFARRHEIDGGTFRSFVRWLGRASRESFEEGESPILESGDAVRIMTIHAAKGLEFPIVVIGDLARRSQGPDTFLVDRVHGRMEFGLEAGEGTLFSAGYEAMKAHEAGEIQSERRRLLYVAATRARDLLILPVSGAGGRDSFLADLEAGGALPTESGGSGEGRLLTLPNGAVVGLLGVELPSESGGPVEARDSGEAPAGGGTLFAGAAEDPTTGPAWAPGGHGTAADEGGPMDDGARVNDSAARGGGTDEGGGTAPSTVAGIAGSQVPASELERWAAARRMVLEAASAGPRVLTASQAAEAGVESPLSAASPPRAAVLSDLPHVRREHPAATEARARAGAEARAFGLAVHGVLEASDLFDASALKALAAAETLARGCPEKADEAEAAARRALGTASIRRAPRSRRVLRETPVVFLDQGVMVEGQIDLVYEEDDGSLIVVDFKTDAVEDAAEATARAEAYRDQMALYAEALERATGRQVREAVLLFLDIGHEVRQPFDSAMRAAAARAIARTAEA